MINNIEEFFEVLNKMLEKYNTQVDEIGNQPNGVVAYYNLGTKKIYINKHCNYIFNDYITLVETCEHEEVHKINHKLDIQDVFMEGEKQVHNKSFNDTFYKAYGLKSSKYNGEVDFKESENLEKFEELVVKKITDKQVFKELQEYFLNNIYEYKPNNEGNEPQPNNDNEEGEGNEPQENEGEEGKGEKGENQEPHERPNVEEYEYIEEEGVDLN